MSRVPFKYLWFLLGNGMTVSCATAASLSYAVVKAEVVNPSIRVSHLSSEYRRTVNLEAGREGLTPDTPILITVAGAGPMIWSGTLNFGANATPWGYGSLELILESRLSLVVGEISGFTAVNLNAAVADVPTEMPEGDFEYETSLAAPVFSFVVPWETNLSQATLKLFQESWVEADAMARFGRSSLVAAGATGSGFSDLGAMTITLSSVPEPGIPCLTAISAACWLALRRRGNACAL